MFLLPLEKEKRRVETRRFLLSNPHTKDAAILEFREGRYCERTLRPGGVSFTYNNPAVRISLQSKLATMTKTDMSKHVGFCHGGRYKTRIQDIACYIVLKYIKTALFVSFLELFCPTLSLLLPTCVNLLRLKISKTFGRYIPLTSRERRTPYSATKQSHSAGGFSFVLSIITEVISSINWQSYLNITFLPLYRSAEK